MTDIRISVNLQTINFTNSINEEPTTHASICAICQFQFDGVIIFIERGRIGGGPARSCVRNSGLLVVLLTRTCEKTPRKTFIESICGHMVQFFPTKSLAICELFKDIYEVRDAPVDNAIIHSPRGSFPRRRPAARQCSHHVPPSPHSPIWTPSGRRARASV